MTPVTLRNEEPVLKHTFPFVTTEPEPLSTPRTATTPKRGCRGPQAQCRGAWGVSPHFNRIISRAGGWAAQLPNVRQSTRGIA
jgi:hypothetical protein